MTKLEFSDFYKFIVSLGVVLISMSLLLPWLFLREPLDALITADELAQLTPTAQVLISIRQETALWFLRNVKWMSGTLASFGILLLTIGLLLWSKRQRELDRKSRIETKKLEAETGILERKMQAMTPAEIADKAIREGQAIEVASEDIGAPELKGVVVPSVIAQYFELEAQFANNLTECLGEEGQVVSHQRIGPAEYDTIVIPQTPGRPDVIIELKLVKSRTIIMQRLRQGVDQTTQLLETFKEATRRDARGLLLFVAPESVIDPSEANSYRIKLQEQYEQLNKGVFVEFVSEDRLSELDCATIENIIYPPAADSH